MYVPQCCRNHDINVPNVLKPTYLTHYFTTNFYYIGATYLHMHPHLGLRSQHYLPLPHDRAPLFHLQLNVQSRYCQGVAIFKFKA